jgi:hypothetical protein
MCQDSNTHPISSFARYETPAGVDAGSAWNNQDCHDGSLHFHTAKSLCKKAWNENGIKYRGAWESVYK